MAQNTDEKVILPSKIGDFPPIRVRNVPTGKIEIKQFEKVPEEPKKLEETAVAGKG